MLVPPSPLVATRTMSPMGGRDVGTGKDAPAPALSFLPGTHCVLPAQGPPAHFRGRTLSMACWSSLYSTWAVERLSTNLSTVSLSLLYM